MCALTYRSASALPFCVCSFPRRSFTLPGVP